MRRLEETSNTVPMYRSLGEGLERGLELASGLAPTGLVPGLALELSRHTLRGYSSQRTQGQLLHAPSSQ